MNPIYLLDTNIYSEPAKPSPDSELVERLAKNVKLSAISVVSWSESLYGVKKLPDGIKKARLEDYLLNNIQANFEILPFDANTAWVYTDLRTRLEEAGTPVPDADLKIAATAISNGMILITRNLKDFENIKKHSTLAILNWFEEE
ncbi:MAG: PIN domain-containing protein [Treponema sp.]|nr:PIN domain-containing protein [Candidatus Treponema equifaecale]